MPPLPDILLFALTAALPLSVAAYFATQRPHAQTAAPTGLAVGGSLAATLAALLLLFVPGEAYYLGLKGIVPAAMIWLLVPLLAWNLLPGIVGPTIGSPLAYLQRRFGSRVASAAGLVSIAGRLLASSLALAALARMLSLALGGLPPMLVAFAVGVLAAVCVACCGKRGGVWLGVTLAAVMAVGVPFAIATVVKQNGGPEPIWQVGQATGRTWIGDPTLDASSAGVTWNLLPAVWAGLLVFLLGDEATAARLSQLRSASAVRTALLMLLAAATFFAAAWMYAGLGLFVFYREHPEQVRTQWVVNVEPETRLSRTDPETQLPLLDPATGRAKRSLLSEGIQYDAASGTPLLTWEEADIAPEELEALIAQQRLYGRNGQPVRSPSEVLDETGERIDPRKLALQSLATNERPSELLLHRRATEELWPQFVATQAPVGMRGLLVGGLLAAALAAVDLSGLGGLPQILGLTTARSTSTERTLSAAASLVATLLAVLWVFVVPFPADAMLYVVASSLAPIVGVVLVGLTSRRATPAVAAATLIVGIATGLALSLGISTDPRGRIHPLWSLTLSLGGTFLMGQVLAAVFGQSRRRRELQGLVLGPVPIGALHDPEHEASDRLVAIDEHDSA